MWTGQRNTRRGRRIRAAEFFILGRVPAFFAAFDTISQQRPEDFALLSQAITSLAGTFVSYTRTATKGADAGA